MNSRFEKFPARAGNSGREGNMHFHSTMPPLK
jgi:hypothetical protein